MSVLVVEDDDLVRLSVSRLIGHHERLQVVGQAASIAELAGWLDRGKRADVALVDLSLPDGSGMVAIRRLRAVQPRCVSLAFTASEDEDSVFAALRAGARGYLLKTTSPVELPRLVLEAVAGGAPMSPSIARLVVRSFEEQGGVGTLTAREKDVLALLVKGLSYKQVGTALGISIGTIQTHVKHLYEKLEVSSKAEATMVAVRERLV